MDLSKAFDSLNYKLEGHELEAFDSQNHELESLIGNKSLFHLAISLSLFH